MRERFTFLPLRCIALYGFMLNMLWEFVQCYLFYDMWHWSFWRITAWMWGAIFGDVLIVLGVALLASLLVGSSRLLSFGVVGWITLVGIGFAMGIFLEWLAQWLALWGYSSFMPTLTILGRTVGLSPIVQVTLLPALSVYLATRHQPF